MPITRRPEKHQREDDAYQDTENLTENVPGLGVFLLRKDKHSRKRRRQFIQLGRSQKAKVVKVTYGVIEGVCRAITPSEHMDLLDAVVHLHKNKRRRQAREQSGAVLSEDAKALLWDDDDEGGGHCHHLAGSGEEEEGDKRDEDCIEDEDEDDEEGEAGQAESKPGATDERSAADAMNEEDEQPPGGGKGPPPPDDNSDAAAADRPMTAAEFLWSKRRPKPAGSPDLISLIKDEATRIQQKLQAKQHHRQHQSCHPPPLPPQQPSQSSNQRWLWMVMDSSARRGGGDAGQRLPSDQQVMRGQSAAAHHPAHSFQAGDSSSMRQRLQPRAAPPPSRQHHGGSAMPTFEYLPIGRPLELRAALQPEEMLAQPWARQSWARAAPPYSGVMIGDADRPPSPPSRHAGDMMRGLPGRDSEVQAGQLLHNEGAMLLKSMGHWASTVAPPPSLRPPHGACNNGSFVKETSSFSSTTGGGGRCGSQVSTAETASSTALAQYQAESTTDRAGGAVYNVEEWRQQHAMHLHMLRAQSSETARGSAHEARTHHAGPTPGHRRQPPYAH